MHTVVWYQIYLSNIKKKSFDQWNDLIRLDPKSHLQTKEWLGKEQDEMGMTCADTDRHRTLRWFMQRMIHIISNISLVISDRKRNSIVIVILGISWSHSEWTKNGVRITTKEAYIA